MKSIFEELGGTYTLGEDGMYYPNLELPVEEEPHYGKYGRMRMNYIKEGCIRSFCSTASWYHT